VKRPQFPDTHHYVFEMTVGIHSALAFSPGEISTLFVDRLFALDEEGKLFPGVTAPEDRLRLAGMEPIGYERSRQRGPGDAYTTALAILDHPSKSKRELGERLDTAIETIDAAILRQRMLNAKLGGLRAKCHHPAALAGGDRKTADALLSAAEAIIAAVEAATKPVL
jgi:hypothetical protein